MKDNKLFKCLTVFLLSFVGILVAATLLIGNYFVSYALVPNNEEVVEREVVDDDLPDGVEAIEETAIQTIQTNREQAQRDSDEWVSEVEPVTKEVSVQTTDQLTLHGNAFYQEQPTDNWVILVHGYQGSENSMYSVGANYYAQGFNVLTFNHRGMQTSDGDYITMGIKEQYDLVAWLEALVSVHPEANIVTHGDSMGAATVLMASGLEEYSEEFVAVVANSAYTSVWEVFESELYQRFDIPAFPTLHMTSLVGIPRVDINLFTEGDTVSQVENSDTPTLFIHGTADDFVPYPMVHTLYEAHPLEEKELYIVKGAGHMNSCSKII